MFTGSSVLNYTRFDKKQNWTPSRSIGRSPFTPQNRNQENLPRLTLQSAPWPFCPSAPVSRTLWDANVAQTVFSSYRAGKDRMGQGRTAATFLLLVYSASKLRHRVQGMNRDSFIYARLIWLVLHRDPFDKTGTGRLACSTCVPHGALRASDCQ